jgi:hypothetical protein
MEQIDIYMKNNNLNGSISECIRKNYIYLGNLLCEINKDSDNLLFLESFIQLKNSLNNIKSDNTLFTPLESSNKKIIKIKLECNWLDSKSICNIWNKMSFDNYKWEDSNSIIELTWKDEYDYLIIINSTETIDYDDINPKNTILIRMEPYMVNRPDLWGKWSNPNPLNFLDIISYERNFNNIEWHLNKTYKQLINDEIIKTKDIEISTILSSKYIDPGQIKRIDFAKFLDNKNDIILDVYGDNKYKYKNFKCGLPYHNKDDGLIPYKYTFNCENFELTGYFTEKIIDAILSETLIFYHGCPDIYAYIDKRAFVWLDLSNFESDYNYIKKCINEKLWEQRLPYIREAKKKILSDLQFFPRIKKIIDRVEIQK